MPRWPTPVTGRMRSRRTGCRFFETKAAKSVLDKPSWRSKLREEQIFISRESSRDVEMEADQVHLVVLLGGFRQFRQGLEAKASVYPTFRAETA